METEFGGLPVDGGTIPALIWHDVVTAWDEPAGRPGRREAGGQSGDDHDHDSHRHLRAAGHDRGPDDDTRARRPGAATRSGAGTRRRRPRRRRRSPPPRRRAPAPRTPAARSLSPADLQRPAGRERNGLPARQYRHGQLGRLGDADPRARRTIRRVGPPPPGRAAANGSASASEARLGELDPQCLAELARARAEFADRSTRRRPRIASIPAVGSSARTAPRRDALRLGDDVEHRVDAVAEVDVGAPGRAEQGRVAGVGPPKAWQAGSSRS